MGCLPMPILTPSSQIFTTCAISTQFSLVELPPIEIQPLGQGISSLAGWKNRTPLPGVGPQTPPGIWCFGGVFGISLEVGQRTLERFDPRQMACVKQWLNYGKEILLSLPRLDCGTHFRQTGKLGIQNNLLAWVVQNAPHAATHLPNHPWTNTRGISLVKHAGNYFQTRDTFIFLSGIVRSCRNLVF